MTKQDIWNLWNLKTERGRQRWFYEGKTDDESLRQLREAFTYNKKENPNSGDRVYRNKKAAASYRAIDNSQIPVNESLTGELPKEVFRSLYKGVNFYESLQADEGHWPGDYGGPMFLLPGLIITSYVTGVPFPKEHQEMMKCYLLNHQNDDGGWGLHLEGKSTMFGTVLQYVSLRILGLGASHPRVASARQWLQSHGGATGIPSWGKFYLSVLGAYEWKGCNSLFPEMWLLPRSLPIHPGNYWCHARMVYLPMTYCSGHQVTGAITPLVEALRKELYTQEYEDINWKEARNRCSETDLYFPMSGTLKTMYKLLNVYEGFHLKSIRKKALDFTLSYIRAEDDHTNFIDIGPVNKVINSLCIWHAEGKDSPNFKKHVERWNDYLWVAEDGMKMNGYNGSQLWDTTFATQAILEGGMEKYFPDAVKNVYHYIDISQVREEVRDHKYFFRHDSVGGWAFSTADHGWPITDCTAEGLKSSLMVNATGLILKEKQISDERLIQAAELLPTFQNADGGWASYELTRAPQWIELLNPSEVFGNIMADYSYTECSSACIQGMVKFLHYFPNHKKQEFEASIRRGMDFILGQQRADGSWYGSWAVCFTYGIWFAIDALQHVQYASDKSKVKTAMDKACAFLLSKQNTDGGWGENFESCVQKEYIPHEQSQVVNTAWALLSLMAADYPDKTVIEKGIQFLLSRQQPTGDWEQESISGVFNHNCMISYTSYRNVFPIWALGRYLKKYGNETSSMGQVK
ncbi:MAG: terpene cyclase/mutase family protein [Bacteroidetes bacterium]|nr:terpene cyclase/mutase family protein [Bacteroidota bacterium]